MVSGPEWLSAVAAVGAVIASVVAPLLARSTLSSGLKRADDLLELAQRFENIEQSSPEAKGKALSKDLYVKYKKVLDNYHFISLIGIPRLTVIFICAMLLAVLLFGFAIIIDNRWSWALFFGGLIGSFAIPVGAVWIIREMANREVTNMPDDEISAIRKYYSESSERTVG